MARQERPVVERAQERPQARCPGRPAGRPAAPTPASRPVRSGAPKNGHGNASDGRPTYAGRRDRQRQGPHCEPGQHPDLAFQPRHRDRPPGNGRGRLRVDEPQGVVPALGERAHGTHDPKSGNWAASSRRTSASSTTTSARHSGSWGDRRPGPPPRPVTRRVPRRRCLRVTITSDAPGPPLSRIGQQARPRPPRPEASAVNSSSVVSTAWAGVKVPLPTSSISSTRPSMSVSALGPPGRAWRMPLGVRRGLGGLDDPSLAPRARHRPARPRTARLRPGPPPLPAGARRRCR